MVRRYSPVKILAADRPRPVSLRDVTIYKISPVSWPDVRQPLVKLEEKVLQGRANGEKYLTDAFSDPTAAAHVAMRRGKAIGMIVARPLEKFKMLSVVADDRYLGQKNTIFIELRLVAPEYQAHGIGSRLRQVVMQEAAAKGFRFVTGIDLAGAQPAGSMVIKTLADNSSGQPEQVYYRAPLKIFQNGSNGARASEAAEGTVARGDFAYEFHLRAGPILTEIVSPFVRNDWMSRLIPKPILHELVYNPEIPRKLFTGAIIIGLAAAFPESIVQTILGGIHSAGNMITDTLSWFHRIPTRIGQAIDTLRQLTLGQWVSGTLKTVWNTFVFGLKTPFVVAGWMMGMMLTLLKYSLIGAAIAIPYNFALAWTIRKFRSFFYKPFIMGMLRHSDYRTRLESSPRGQRIMARIKRLGIHKPWDDPHYFRVYEARQGTVSSISREDPIQMANQVVDRLFGEGYQGGKPRGGDLAKWFKKGGATARHITRQFHDTIQSIRAGNASRDSILFFLNEIKINHCVPRSEADRVLDAAIEQLVDDADTTHGQIRASIWKRDPWVDLSSSEEFHACTFLGGGNETAAAAYINNLSICCLDFADHTPQRLLRSIEGAAHFRFHGKRHGLLLVDSVEGTLSLPPSLTYQGIRDHAIESGFKAIIFNNSAQNVVPKKFLAYVASLGLPETKINTRLAEFDAPQYFEAFDKGFALPRGEVEGFLDILDYPSHPTGKIRVGSIELTLDTYRPSEIDWERIQVPIFYLHQFLPVMQQAGLADMRNTFQDWKSIVLLARHEGKIAGYVAGGPLEDYGDVEWVLQDPEFGKKTTFYIELCGASSKDPAYRRALRQAIIDTIFASTAYSLVTGAAPSDEIPCSSGNPIVSATHQPLSYFRIPKPL